MGMSLIKRFTILTVNEESLNFIYAECVTDRGCVIYVLKGKFLCSYIYSVRVMLSIDDQHNVHVYCACPLEVMINSGNC